MIFVHAETLTKWNEFYVVSKCTKCTLYNSVLNEMPKLVHDTRLRLVTKVASWLIHDLFGNKCQQIGVAW